MTWDEQREIVKTLFEERELEPDYWEIWGSDEMQLDGEFSLVELETFVEAMQKLKALEDASMRKKIEGTLANGDRLTLIADSPIDWEAIPLEREQLETPVTATFSTKCSVCGEWVEFEPGDSIARDKARADHMAEFHSVDLPRQA